MRVLSYGLGVVLLMALGCGETAPQGPSLTSEDAKQIAKLIDDLNEMKANNLKFKTLFNKNAPAAKHYDPMRYDIVESPIINGETATAKIKLVSDSNNKEMGVQTWTFTKVNHVWKVESAPLK